MVITWQLDELMVEIGSMVMVWHLCYAAVYDKVYFSYLSYIYVLIDNFLCYDILPNISRKICLL